MVGPRTVHPWLKLGVACYCHQIMEAQDPVQGDQNAARRSWADGEVAAGQPRIDSADNLVRRSDLRGALRPGGRCRYLKIFR